MSFIGALFKKPKAPDNPLTLSLDPNSPRKLILGKTALAGSFAFHGLSNKSRDLTRVAILAGHRCNGVTRVWADGQLAYTGRLQHGVRTPMTTFRHKGDPHLWLTWYDGRPNQTADSWLRTTAHSPIGWGFNDRLRGCSYVVVTMRHDKDNINTVMEMVFEVEGAPLYDRRLDSTAGGSGPQRWNNPASWSYTDNAAVATDHYQLGMVGGVNNDKLIFGMGLKPWQVPYDEFEANADTCDEIVFGRARYATNGVLSAADDHKDNIVRLAEAMAAVPYDTGGRVIIRPQQSRPISLTLHDSDLVSGADYDLSESPGGDDLVNTVRGEYREPSVRYKEQEYPSVQDDDLISKDGRAFEVTLNLPLENNSARAQRLANIELEVQKRRDIIEETFMPIANVLEVGDWFSRVSNLRGPSTKSYEVIDKQVFADKTVRIKGRETDPAITAFAVDQARPVEEPDPLPPFLPDRPDSPPSIAVGGSETGGGASIPDGTITIVPDVSDDIERFDYFEVEYGVSNGQDPVGILDGTRKTATFANEDQLELHLTGLLPATVYAWRLRGVTAELSTEWGAYQTFLTTSDLISTNTANVGSTSASLLVSRLGDAEQSISDIEVNQLPLISTSLADAQQSISEAQSDLSTLDGELDAAVSQAETERSQISSDASLARDALSILIQDLDGDLDAVTSRVGTAETSLTTLQQVQSDENALRVADITSLTGRISDAESDISGQTSDISALDSRVGTVETDKASVAALNSLTSRVTDAESDLTSKADLVYVDSVISSEQLTRAQSISELSIGVNRIGAVDFSDPTKWTNSYDGVTDPEEPRWNFTSTASQGFFAETFRSGTIYDKREVVFPRSTSISVRFTGRMISGSSDGELPGGALCQLIAVVLNSSRQSIDGKTSVRQYDSRALAQVLTTGDFELHADLTEDDLEAMYSEHPNAAYIIFGVEVLRGASEAGGGRVLLLNWDLDLSAGLNKLNDVSASLTTLQQVQSDENALRVADITSLTGRISDAESDISGQTSDISALDSRVGTVETDKASVAALNSLTSRVTDAESDLNSAEANIGSLQTVTSDLQLNKAEASALNSLTSRVTDAESDLTSKADLVYVDSVISSEQLTRAQSISELSLRVSDRGPDNFSRREDWTEDGVSDPSSAWNFTESTGFGRQAIRLQSGTIYEKREIVFDAENSISVSFSGANITLPSDGDVPGNSSCQLMALALDGNFNVIGVRVFLAGYDARARVVTDQTGQFDLRADLSPANLQGIISSKPGVVYLRFGVEILRGSSLAGGGEARLYSWSVDYGASVDRINDVSASLTTLQQVQSDENALRVADITSLTGRISDAESDISGQTSDISALDSRVGTVETDKASVAALNSLTSRVTDAESDLTSKADLSQLSSVESDLNSSISSLETDLISSFSAGIGSFGSSRVYYDPARFLNSESQFVIDPELGEVWRAYGPAGGGGVNLSRAGGIESYIPASATRKVAVRIKGRVVTLDQNGQARVEFLAARFNGDGSSAGGRIGLSGLSHFVGTQTGYFEFDAGVWDLSLSSAFGDLFRLGLKCLENATNAAEVLISEWELVDVTAAQSAEALANNALSAVADETLARSQAISSLSATLSGEVDAVDGRVDTNEASIGSLQLSVADEASARSLAISEISARVSSRANSLMNDYRDWTRSNNGSPSTASDAPSNDFVDDADHGPVWRKTSSDTLLTKALWPLQEGAAFDISAEFVLRQVPSDGGGICQIVGIAQDENNVRVGGRIFFGGTAAFSATSAGEYTLTLERSVSEILASRPGAKFMRWGVELLRLDANGEALLKNIDVSFGTSEAKIQETREVVADVQGNLAAERLVRVGANGKAASLVQRAVTTGDLTVTEFIFDADKLRHAIDGDLVWESTGGGMELRKPQRLVGPVLANGSQYMLVQGPGNFGQEFADTGTGDLIWWYGPYAASNDACRKSNSIRAITIEGEWIEGGAVAPGQPVTSSGSNSSLSGPTISASTGESTSVGNDVEVTYGYSFSKAQFNPPSGLGHPPTWTPTATIKLYKKLNGASSWSLVATKNISGSGSYEPGFESNNEYEPGLGEGFLFENLSGSFNHVETGLGANDTYDWKVDLTSRYVETSGDSASLSVSSFEAGS